MQPVAEEDWSTTDEPLADEDWATTDEVAARATAPSRV